MTVTETVGEGPPVVSLRDRSADAGLVVVGGHGHHAVAEQVLGSVAASVAAHALCSVIVVRASETPDDGRPVVLGLDESTHAAEAARFAFGQAAARHVGLRAVHAWMPPVDPWIGDRFPDRGRIAAVEETWAAGLMAKWRAEFPTVPVTVESCAGHPYKVLTDAATTGQLTVVGARGHGGFRDLRLGSITRHLLHYGTGTVAVVR